MIFCRKLDSLILYSIWIVEENEDFVEHEECNHILESISCNGMDQVDIFTFF